MQGELRCGAAFTDITPYDRVPGILLAGFENHRRSREVLDPLEAGAIYLTDGDQHVVLVSADLIGFLHPWQERLRDRLAGQVKAPGNVLVTSTHTHSGPDTIGLWGRSLLGLIPLRSGIDRTFMEKLLNDLTGLVLEAEGNVVEVEAKAARFEVGSEWTRNDRKGGGKDDFGHALSFVGPDGEPVATLVNFAAHPETLWEGNPCLSADYPGAVRRHMRERGHPVPVFFSGPLGGMVTPNVAVKARFDERKGFMESLGEHIAGAVCDALSEAVSIPKPTLGCRHLPLELSLSNWRLKLARYLGIIDREFLLDRVRTEMNLVCLGDDVSILTAPGEVTPELGRLISARMTGEHRLILCLGCDELGYVLTPEQYEDREYRYERSMSIGPGTGPALLAATGKLCADDF